MPNDDHLPHLTIEGRFEREKYRSKPGRGRFALPPRDRVSHGTLLRAQLDLARQQNEQQRRIATAPDLPAKINLEILSEPEFELALNGLDSKKYGFNLACVREENGQRIAVIHVAENKLRSFYRLVDDYIQRDSSHPKSPPGTPCNRKLIEPIAEIRLAALRAFWTDQGTPFPARDQSVWWEVWLTAESDQGPWGSFCLLAESAGLRVSRETIRFPDRLVGLCFGNAAQLSSSAEILDLLGEVRRAKDNPRDFIEMNPREQAEWVADLRKRIIPPAIDAPSVCLLDGGVVANPLLSPALAREDCLKYDPAWPLTDNEPHGTEMAGIALFGGQLASLLVGTDSVTLRHRLESVKILPPRPRQNDPRLYGAITARAVYKVESQAPTRPRAVCMTVTTDGTDRGKPSSWSGEIDQLCAGVGDGNRRLFFVSAGNSADDQYHKYPDSNDVDPIQDPAQAWNAITVGAHTECVQFSQQQFPGYKPLAPAGDLSPCSTTSLTWFRDWPLKPDVVLEGGNLVIHPEQNLVADPDDMALLTTAHNVAGRLLVPFGNTSAATAQAARMAAILQAEYPHFWPETIRALLIHSAEWTEPMRKAFGGNKQACHNRLRRYGYGVPSLSRALYSARNSLTLISQRSLQPFEKDGNDVTTNHMGLHSLPWPVQQLLELGETDVQMRVTLSYYIEPKPGRRGEFARTRHRYQSHGLRFEVRRPQESLKEFRQRINRAARADGEEYAGAVGDTAGWMLGPNLRTRGSLHSDWWQGPAADLADCGFIAVFPVTGWWREKTDQEYWTRHARYALVVSIRTAANTVDLYTPVQAMLPTPVPIPVPGEIEVDDV
jgi:hypothetical protein